MRLRILIVGLTAILLTGVGAVFGLHHGESPDPGSAQASSSLPAGQAPADQLAASIARAQKHLSAVPGDYPAWAALGSAYTERARVTADPAYYPKAEGALRRSLKLRPTGNPAALVGLGALANARHGFATARDLAHRALRVDPYSADAYGVLADAQTQLGHLAAATEAIQHMLDLRPGLAAYARASYDLEQQGRLDDAVALMRRALGDAVDPADIAFCRYQLGELAWRAGRLDDAETEYTGGQAADPAYLPLLAGHARVAAARGHTTAALADYAKLTARYPSPGYLMDYATLLRAASHRRAPTSNSLSPRRRYGYSGRTAGQTTWVPRSSRSPRAMPGKRCSQLSGSGLDGTSPTSPTCSAGRCTGAAATPRRSPTPARPTRTARTTPGTCSTSA